MFGEMDTLLSPGTLLQSFIPSLPKKKGVLDALAKALSLGLCPMPLLQASHHFLSSVAISTVVFSLGVSRLPRAGKWMTVMMMVNIQSRAEHSIEATLNIYIYSVLCLVAMYIRTSTRVHI